MYDPEEVDWSAADDMHSRVRTTLEENNHPITMTELAAAADVTPFTARYIVSDLAEYAFTSIGEQDGLERCYKSEMDKVFEQAAQSSDDIDDAVESAVEAIRKREDN